MFIADFADVYIKEWGQCVWFIDDNVCERRIDCSRDQCFVRRL